VVALVECIRATQVATVVQVVAVVHPLALAEVQLQRDRIFMAVMVALLMVLAAVAVAALDTLE
jgi:hypothetical protein